MSYRSLRSDEVTLRNYRPVGRRKGNVINAEALAYMRERALATHVIARLIEHWHAPTRSASRDSPLWA
jgi:hypothetical protein